MSDPCGATGGYPPSAFYFRVEISGQGKADASFQEVSGITAQMETEDLVEGGENRFVHKLPKSMKAPNLVLKRGIGEEGSLLVKWCKSVLEGGLIKAIETKPIEVSLLNEKGESMRRWSFANAYPVKWEVAGFNSTKNEVAIETIELCYSYSDRVM